MRPRRRRQRQEGQVLIIAALMTVLIFGALAMGVDLSVQTLRQRTLQNVADAASLAGATDLLTTVDVTQEESAVSEALSTLQTNLGGTWSGGAQPSPAGCGSSECGTGTLVVGGTDYAVAVSTPPTSSRSVDNSGVNDLEVEIRTSVGNALAGILGMPVSAVGAHAVAYHWGPPGPYDYTFFAKTETCTGNQAELIYGDAYIGGGFHPQCNGGGSPAKSALCVYDPSGSSAYGHVTFGVFPPTYGPEIPASDYAFSATCPGGATLTAQAETPQTASPTNCASGSSPVEDVSSGDWGCVMGNPPVPNIVGPECNGIGPWDSLPNATVACTLLSNGATINSSTAQGIYVVPNGGSATLDFSSGNINCVSLELGTGASVSITNKKAQQYMTSYGFSLPDATATGEISALLQTPPTVSCNGASSESPTDNNTCVICAANSTVSPMPVALSNGSTGCCSDTLFVGTVFLPGQTISFQTNQAMEDVGQVYCGDWQVQSGNHPNPMVTRDVQDTDLQGEQLLLVE